MDHYKIYLENILRNVPGSVYWKDINGVYLGCNTFQAEMAGFSSSKDIIGKTDAQLPWKEIAHTLREVDQRVMRTKIPEEIIEIPTLFNGKKIIMLSNKAPLYDEEGKVIGLIGTSLDITALKQAEEREKAALEQVAAAEIKRRKIEEEIINSVLIQVGSIIHDLQTPLVCLNSVGFVLESVLPILVPCYHKIKEHNIDLNRPVSKKEEEKISTILDSPKMIKKFVDEMQALMMDHFKAINRSHSTTLQEEDLIACLSYKGINHALEAYPFKPGERQLVHWDRSHYFTFLGNPVLFLRIIFNLLNNALFQINKKGKGEIFITSERKENWNIIRFKDTAGGETPATICSIFAGDESMPEEPVKGLTFCKKAMKSFGGDIQCQIVENDCTEFVLSFPRDTNGYSK